MPSDIVSNLKGAITPSGMEGIGAVVKGLMESYPGMYMATNAIIYLMGGVLVLVTIRKLYAYSGRSGGRDVNLVSIIVTFMVAIIFLNMPEMIGDITKTTFGANANFMEYAKQGGGAPFKQSMTAVLAFIQFIGYIAFVRGWLVIKSVGDGEAQEGGLLRGIMHIIGGVAAVHIDKTLAILSSTFGLHLEWVFGG